MIRPLWLLPLVAGCATTDVTPVTPVSRAVNVTAADGVVWLVRDDRGKLDEPERFLPRSTLDRQLRQTSFEEVADRPARVELAVASFTQTTRRAAIGGPGDYAPAFMQKDLLGGSNSSGKDGAMSAVFLGLMEAIWGTAYLGWSGMAAADDALAERSGTDPGVTCRLTGTATLTWADGRRADVPIDATGSAMREPKSKAWGPAVQAAHEQVSARVVQQVWQAIRAGP